MKAKRKHSRLTMRLYAHGARESAMRESAKPVKRFSRRMRSASTHSPKACSERAPNHEKTRRCSSRQVLLLSAGYGYTGVRVQGFGNFPAAQLCNAKFALPVSERRENDGLQTLESKRVFASRASSSCSSLLSGLCLIETRAVNIQRN